MSEIKYKFASLKELYQRELTKKGVSESDIEFVLGLIEESKKDENLNRMENDCWKKMQERGLVETFEEISMAHSIKWEHSNESDF